MGSTCANFLYELCAHLYVAVNLLNIEGRTAVDGVSSPSYELVGSHLGVETRGSTAIVHILACEVANLDEALAVTDGLGAEEGRQVGEVTIGTYEPATGVLEGEVVTQLNEAEGDVIGCGSCLSEAKLSTLADILVLDDGMLSI